MTGPFPPPPIPYVINGRNSLPCMRISTISAGHPLRRHLRSTPRCMHCPPQPRRGWWRCHAAAEVHAALFIFDLDDNRARIPADNPAANLQAITHLQDVHGHAGGGQQKDLNDAADHRRRQKDRGSQMRSSPTRPPTPQPLEVASEPAFTDGATFAGCTMTVTSSNVPSALSLAVRRST